VIVIAVRWYLRFGLSYRDIEELLIERGIEVDHVTGHCCIWRSLPSTSSTRVLNALVDAQIDRFEHFLQPSGREAPPLCYPTAAPSAQMQQCPAR
jgi:hypothetical protein